MDGVRVGRIDAYVGQAPQMVRVTYGALEGLVYGVQRTWEVAVLSLKMLGKMLIGEASLKNLSGPLTIADVAGQSVQLGLAFNEMVRRGQLKGPIVIGRDHLDCGSVASPNRETEAMRDGSDAVSDWPLLNALTATAGGATWVSLHHGGGVGMGYSQHAGVVIVCDGTPEADRRLERVLWNDPALGVVRHADAGYELAQDCARRHGLHLPMLFQDDRA